MSTPGEPDRGPEALPARVAYTESGAALFQLLRELELSLPRLSALPVSQGRMGLLRTLALRGPLHGSEVARLRGVSRQGVLRLAEALEREGLVASRPHPDNARARLIELTEAGARAYHGLAAQEARELNALAAGLTPADLRGAARVLHVLADRARHTDARRGSR